MFKWKISTDSLCNVCKVEEDYDHFFMSCKYLDIFWNKINEMLKKVQFENNIRFKDLVFGYKIFDRIFSPKLFFNYIGIYNLQTYYVSEQKTKTIDVYLLFKNEFQRKMKENKLLGMNSLFNHILNKM